VKLHLLVCVSCVTAILPLGKALTITHTPWLALRTRSPQHRPYCTSPTAVVACTWLGITRRVVGFGSIRGQVYFALENVYLCAHVLYGDDVCSVLLLCVPALCIPPGSRELSAQHILREVRVGLL
jgi:hypothetical protein